MARKNATDSKTNPGTSPVDAGEIDPAIAALSYERAVEELESLVESIESGDVGLEESLTSYRRGEMLLRHCRALLDRAELSVRELPLAELEQGGRGTSRASGE